MQTKKASNPCDLANPSMILIFNRLLQVVKVHVHASSGSRSTMHKNTKTHVTLTLKFNEVLEVVEVHVQCSCTISSS